MLTCKQCVWNVGQINQQNKELQKVCTRKPPTMHIIPTQQGIIANVAYPIINDDFTSCGEYDDGVDVDDIDGS